LAELFHFVRCGEGGVSASPLCADWQHNQAWTTVPAVVTCPACAGLLRWVKLLEVERGPKVPSGGHPPGALRAINQTSIVGLHRGPSPKIHGPSDPGRAAPAVDSTPAVLDRTPRPALVRARPR